MTKQDAIRIAVVSALAVMSASCSGERAEREYYGTSTPRHGPDEAWSNLSTEPEWIDPGRCSDSSGGTVLTNLFAGLVQSHPKTLAPMPDVARGWDISEDGKTYRFHLRQTYWSDGKPLTAHDFEYSFKRVLDRALLSKYATFLYPLENAEAWNREAVMLGGLPAGTTVESLQRALPAAVPVERIALRPERGQATVFLAGVDEKPELRAQALAALRGFALGGAAVSAALATSAVVGVRARGDLLLEVKLEDPLPYFLDLLTFYTALPVPRHVIERLEREGKNPDLWTRTEHIVTNGAFTLSEWKFRQYMVLRKNPRYWDAANVKLERVRLAMVESSNTSLNLYEAGELDYMGNTSLPSEFLDHLRNFADFNSGPFLGTYFFWFNTKAAPVSDKRVRQALSLAVDRESLVKYVTRGGQIPSADLVPDGIAGYRGPRNPLFDPERARKLLREAGYGPERELPPVTLHYNTSEGHKQIAEAVQQMWRKNLGIRVDIENQEWKVYLKTLQATEFQLARMGWIGDYADPYTFLELLFGGNGNNHSNWANSEYDDLLRQANRIRDPAARMQLLLRAERIVTEELPVLPLYVYTWGEMTKPYLRGHFLNYQHRQLFKYWWIDERFYAGAPAPLPNAVPPMLVPDSGAAEVKPTHAEGPP